MRRYLVEYVLESNDLPTLKKFVDKATKLGFTKSLLEPGKHTFRYKVSKECTMREIVKLTKHYRFEFKTASDVFKDQPVLIIPLY